LTITSIQCRCSLRVQCRLEPRTDLGQRRPGREDPGDTQGLETGDVVVGDNPPTNNSTSSRPSDFKRSMTRGTRTRCAPESSAEPQGVGVLLDDGLDDLLGRLVQSRVHDLETGVAERSRDDLGATIVPIQPGLATTTRYVRFMESPSYVTFEGSFSRREWALATKTSLVASQIERSIVLGVSH